MTENGRKRALKDLDALLARLQTRKLKLDGRRSKLSDRRRTARAIKDLKRDAGLSTDSTGS